jgi:hypothetical protein
MLEDNTRSTVTARPNTLRLIALVLLITACGGTGAPVIDPGDGGDYTFDLAPADFVVGIDNPYLPLTVGSRWVFEGGGERTEIEVLAETRVVMGITATVVRDTVTEDGELIEDTYDWFAQDTAGNVWYLGGIGRVCRWRARLHGGVVGSRSRRCAAGHRDARTSRRRPRLPPGVLRR